MARILGLDLGSYSIKGVVFEGGSRNFQVKQFYEIPRAPEGGREETLRTALQALVAELRPGVDQVVAALPGAGLATHVVSLPFVEPKRLEAALPFEVESQLPFELSEAVYDYQPMDQTDSKSDLLVAVVRRDDLFGLQQLLAEYKLDPRILTHPAVTVQNLIQFQPSMFEGAPAGEPICVLDIGHERTQITLGTPGKGLEGARTISGGGKDLSRALAAEFNWSLPEATAWKDQSAQLLDDGTPEQERVVSALMRGILPLLREVRPTIKAHAARTRRNVSRVYLSGGTARLPGLAPFLTQELGIETEVLQLPRSARAIIPEHVGPAAAQAYTLALRGQMSGSRGPRLNFRRGELAFKGQFDYVREKAGTLAAFAAAILAMILISGIARNRVLSKHENDIDELLCQTTQRVIGRCEKNYDVALSIMEGGESPAAAIPKRSAVNLLADVSAGIPTDIKVSFEQIIVGMDRVTLRGDTDSAKSIDKLSTALKGYPCFKDIKEGKIEKSKDGSKVSFQFDIEVDCTPAAATPPTAKAG